MKRCQHQGAGQVYSWGSGEMGQLGFPSLESLPKDQDGYPYQPRAALIPFPQRVVEIAGGDGHTSAVTDTGKLYSWGASACGQLGHDDTDGMPKDVEGYPYQPVPLRVETLVSCAFIVAIACGDAHSVAICQEGRLYSWGGGGCGQLGHSETSKMPKDEDGCPYQPTPRIVDSLRPYHISSIACGKAHTVAVSEPGRIFTWGAGACGQLGHPDTNSFPSDEDGYPFQPVPREVEELSPFKIVDTACGDVHTLALTDTGHLYSFGGGSYGQLGVNSVEKMPVDADNCPYLPTPRLVETLSNVIKLACGDSHSLTINKEGRVYCWGANSCGQLGISMENRSIEKDQDGIPHISIPEKIDQLLEFTIVDIACGEAHSLAVTSTGDLYSWGACSCGQLGLDGCDTMPVDNDGYPYQPVPTLVTNGFTSRPILKVACGGVHNLAITQSDHTLAECLANLFENAAELHADIAFCLEGGEFVCAHMCILKARCLVLYEFTRDRLATSPISGKVELLLENGDCRLVPGVQVDAKKNAFYDFLAFLYSSKLTAFHGPKSPPMSHILAVYHLAGRFQVHALLPQFRQAVRRQLAKKNPPDGSGVHSHLIDMSRALTGPRTTFDHEGNDTSSDADDWKIFFLTNGEALVVDNDVYKETVTKGTLLDLSSSSDDDNGETHTQSLETEMLELLHDTETADVTLVIQNTDEGEPIKIKVHAGILASRSQYYKALFCNAFKETKDNEFILPEELTYPRISALLEYMYADKWVEDDFEFCQEMLSIADCFAVLDLKQLCERVLISHINVDNVCSFFELADKHHCKRLRTRCKHFITGPKFCLVMKTNGFAELPKELIVEACQSHKSQPAPSHPTEPAPGAAATSGSKSGQTQREKLQGDVAQDHGQRNRRYNDQGRTHGLPPNAISTNTGTARNPHALPAVGTLPVIISPREEDDPGSPDTPHYHSPRVTP